MLTDLEGPVQLSNTPNVISRLALSLNQRVYELLFAVGCADELVRGPGAAACHACGSRFPWPSVSLPLQLGALTWTWFSLARLRWDVSSKCQSTFVNILRWRSEHVPTGCRPTWGHPRRPSSRSPRGRLTGSSLRTAPPRPQGPPPSWAIKPPLCLQCPAGNGRTAEAWPGEACHEHMWGRKSQGTWSHLRLCQTGLRSPGAQIQKNLGY